MNRPGSKRRPATRPASASSFCLTPAATSAPSAIKVSTTAVEVEVGARTTSCMLQLANQEQIIGTPFANHDVMLNLVNLAVFHEQGILTHQIAAFDQHIRHR